MNARFLVLTSMILVAAFSRLVPHPPNFAPITSLALFSGAYFGFGLTAFVVPFAAMLLSDLFIGFHSLMPVIYGCFFLMVWLGQKNLQKPTALRVGIGTFFASAIFFILSNLGVWLTTSYYEKSIAGLLTCYTAALPFWGNALAGDAFYSILLFGGFSGLTVKFPSLSFSRIRSNT
jgi:fucose 4-O-acetylase-like acetyltransferase